MQENSPPPARGCTMIFGVLCRLSVSGQRLRLYCVSITAIRRREILRGVLSAPASVLRPGSALVFPLIFSWLSDQHYGATGGGWASCQFVYILQLPNVNAGGLGLVF